MRQKRRLLLSVITVAIVGLLSTSALGSSTIERFTDAETLSPYELSLISNECVFTYQDYYTTARGETVFPDYFAGSALNEDGTVTIWLTDMADSVQDKVREVCNDTQGVIHFELAEYSFNDLLSCFLALKENFVSKYSEEDVFIELDIKDNSLKIFCADELPGVIATEARPLLTSEDLFGAIDIEPLTAYAAWDENNKQAVITKEQSFESMNASVVDAAKAGMKNTFYNEAGEPESGTIGFTALLDDGDGEFPVVITHGHRITWNYAYSSIQNGLVNTDLYELQYQTSGDGHDFAVYTVRNDTISSRRLASTKRFVSAFGSYAALLSHVGTEFFFYGATSGEKTFPSLTVGEGSFM